MIKSLFAVIIGGSVGCTLRWLLSTRFMNRPGNPGD